MSIRPRVTLSLAVIFILVLLFLNIWNWQLPQLPFSSFKLPSPSPTITYQQPDRLTINGVVVKNFLKNMPTPPDNTSVVIYGTENTYQFYYRPDKSFLILLLNNPFDKIRQEAEQRFLTFLGISQKDACKLSVQVESPHYVTPELNGQDFPLSFCSN